jgi:predicted DNA-binding transcriptional regulator AlpA
MSKTKVPNATAPPLAPNASGSYAPDAPETAERMLDEAQILALVPFGRTTLWRKEKDGSFPPSSYISPNRHAWFESDVVDWQNSIKGRGRRQQSQPKTDKAKQPKAGG